MFKKMELPIENTYGFFRVDERCKKLERTVKMLQLKQEKKNTENCALDTGTNISSINEDVFDTSCAYSSKLGSEIVSSSSNMKNLFGHKMNLFKNNNHITTSSVKNSPDNDSARTIMPPPRSIPASSISSRKHTPAACKTPTSNQRHVPTGLGSNGFHPTSSVISSIKCSSSHRDNSPIKYATGNENPSNRVTNIKPDRIFERWKVMINDQGQLIIKGVLKDGKKNVRSKPVIRRINASVVQSCFNHIYELQGRIYDDKHELPEYIRGKFYNGFPDDWENVFQLWRSYNSGGCKLSFRWPTPVTDSDDDLQSDITELTHPTEEKRLCSRTKSRRDSISSEKKLTNGVEPMLTETPKVSIEHSKLSVKKVQNVTDESSKKTVTISEEANDTPIEVNSFLEKMRDQYFNNSSNTNHTIDENISSAVTKILNNKNCSIEYIDKIIEMFNCYKYIITSNSQNTSTNITNNNSNNSTTEKVPSIERVSNNSNVTYTKVESIQTHTPKGSNPRSARNRSYNFDSVSKPSPSASNVPSIGKVRRQLDKRDYESSEVSDSDTEFQRHKSPRVIPEMCENRRTTRSMSHRKHPLHKVHDDSDDDFIPKKLIRPSGGNIHTNKPVTNTHTQTNEVDSDGFTKPISKISSGNVIHNPMSRNLPPKKYHRQQKAGSPSTITGFLVNYDSCVSISEDDRRVSTPQLKLNDKRTVNDIDGKTLLSFKLNLNQENSNYCYDSSVSITEDERKYIGEQMNKPDIRKQVLQESNIQYFQQMLKRNMKHKTNSTEIFKNNHRQDQSIVEERCSSSQRKEPKDFAFSKHANTHLNDNKENTSDRIQKEHQSNPHFSENDQTNASKPDQLQEKIKPSIISVEEVSYDVDNLLSKRGYREEPIKNSYFENKKNKNGLRVNNSLPTISTSKNVSDVANSKSLDLDFQTACKDVSVQLKDIKSSLKPKSNAENIINNDKSNEKVVYGSKENPKQLTSWFPNVIEKSDSTYGLVFEGKLLNEAGHVINKKFRTGFVIKKVSSKILMTDKNEFYQLIGDVTDTKHVVPKEMYKHCIIGCPRLISTFCEKWRKIIDESDKLNETMNKINIKNVAQSSRGRRIVPSLSYWSGERLSVRGDATVYTPPTSFRNAFETSKKEHLSLSKKNQSYSGKQDKETNFSKEKENIIHEQVIETNKEQNETARPKKKKDLKLRRSFRKRKELIKYNKPTTDSDSSSEEEEPPLSKRRRKGHDNTRKQQNLQEGLNKNEHENKLSSFDNNESKQLKSQKNITHKQLSNSPVNSNEISVKYYKTASRKNDLSEYESSIIG